MGTVRLVVFGDTHLGLDSTVTARVERRRRGDDFEANFVRVLAYALDNAADVLVHCGDFFHRSRVHPAIVDAAFERLGAVARAGIPVLLVPGNHDRSRLPPSLWLGHPDIHVFDRPRTVALAVRGRRLAFAGFPFAWGDLRSQFATLVERTGLAEMKADAAFLCMHHTVAGATVGPGEFVFRSGKDVLPRRFLPPNLAGVLAGHIHRHQVLEGPHPPVFYPGSIERTSFAERDEGKGFLELTLAEDRTVDWEFIRLPVRPMLDVDIPPSLRPDCIAQFLSARAATLPADAVVRVRAGEHMAEYLSASMVRSVFPRAMNVQWSGEFARGRR